MTIAPPSIGSVRARSFHARAALRLVEREAHIYRRLWWGNFFSSFVSPFLYLGAMGIGLGGLVDAAGHDVGGVPYLQFVAPGLLAGTVMQTAVGESMWPVLGGMRWTRHFHAMVAAPMTSTEVFVGFVVWSGLRLAMNAAVFLVVAGLLGALGAASAVLALPFAVLTGLAFVAPVTAFAATQQEDAYFSLLMRIGVLPLFLFSGTFFATAQLPDALEPLTWLSPLWHGVELCRAATTGHLGDLGAPMIAAHLAVLVGCVLVGGLAGIRTFNRRLSA